MNNLSITQEYLICALNEKGRISSFDMEKQVCFVAAGLLEMQITNCICIDKKTVVITGGLPAEKSYLKSLYDFINQHKAVKIDKIAEAYTYSFSDKRLSELLEAVSGSLEAMGMIKAYNSGVFGNKKSYTLKKETVSSVVDKTRTEILGNGPVSESVAALVTLLRKGGLLKTCFSKAEQKAMKEKLKEIANTPNGETVKRMVDYVDGMLAVMVTVIVT